MDQIQSAWERIAKWYSNNVPSEEFSLAEGAMESDIDAAEAELNVCFPEDVRQSYRLHNGSDHCAVFGYGFHLLSLEELVAIWKTWRDQVENGVFQDMVPNPVGPIKATWWNLNWLPLSHNAGGDHHCIDMDPDVGGSVGQVIKFSHEPGPQRVLAESLRSFLCGFAEALEVGQYQFDEVDLWLIPVNGE